jgi:hypothetical protein
VIFLALARGQKIGCIHFLLILMLVVDNSPWGLVVHGIKIWIRIKVWYRESRVWMYLTYTEKYGKSVSLVPDWTWQQIALLTRPETRSPIPVMVGASAVTARQQSGSVRHCTPRRWAPLCWRGIDGDGWCVWGRSAPTCRMFRFYLARIKTRFESSASRS